MDGINTLHRASVALSGNHKRLSMMVGEINRPSVMLPSQAKRQSISMRRQSSVRGRKVKSPSSSGSRSPMGEDSRSIMEQLAHAANQASSSRSLVGRDDSPPKRQGTRGKLSSFDEGESDESDDEGEAPLVDVLNPTNKGRKRRSAAIVNVPKKGG